MFARNYQNLGFQRVEYPTSIPKSAGSRSLNDEELVEDCFSISTDMAEAALPEQIILLASQWKMKHKKKQSHCEAAYKCEDRMGEDRARLTQAQTLQKKLTVSEEDYLEGLIRDGPIRIPLSKRLFKVNFASLPVMNLP